MSAVRLHCHRIALYNGLPEDLFHATTVSPWLAIPTAVICLGEHLAARIAIRVERRTDSQMTSGSCSTQAGLGRILGTALLPNPATWPFSSKRTAFVLVVP